MEAVVMQEELYIVRKDIIRFHRVRERLTQEQVAMKAGLAKATISRVETGEHKPRFTTVEKIATALGSDPDDFIEYVVTGNGNSEREPTSSDGSSAKECNASLNIDVEQNMGADGQRDNNSS